VIKYDVPQGSDAWLRLRAGKQTASLFYLMRASARLKVGPNAGDYSNAQKDLAFGLAIERISQEPLAEGFETWSQSRGHLLEPEARREHETQMGVIVQPTGFVTTDDGLFGASLDGLIDTDGAAEYKAFIAPTKLRAVITEHDSSMVMDQCQGGLWITGRKWIDFCLYCPALRCAGKHLIVQRIYRDDNYIEELESDLLEFKALIDQYEAALRGPLEFVERIDTPMPRRKLPAPLPAHMVQAPAASPFERRAARIKAERDPARIHLILSSASDVNIAELVALTDLANARITELEGVPF